MGNFSRNTFNPSNNYVGVRLQQGVPLVDADWNELNDVVRYELYDALKAIFGESAREGLEIEQIVLGSRQNNFIIRSGSAIIKGRLVRFEESFLAYIQQPWKNPVRASQVGIEPIADLTTPVEANRIDLVYLDVWEREVTSQEDENIVNPNIGIETSVRLKREVAIRVLEGVTTTIPAPPPEPSGHFYMPLAFLRRPADEPNILIEQVSNIRPNFFALKGVREVAFPPIFLPFRERGITYSEWITTTPEDSSSIIFARTLAPAPTSGIMPISVPDGAKLTHMKCSGRIESLGTLRITLSRIAHESGSRDVLASGTYTWGAGRTEAFNFNQTLPVAPVSFLTSRERSEELKSVNNSLYSYAIQATTDQGIAGGSSTICSIYGMSVRFEY